jgi:hypothetical protein
MATRLFHLRAIAHRAYLRSCGPRVQAGPFLGMNYVTVAHCSAIAPKLAGSYERELRNCLAQLVAVQPDLFVDVGAAEGYYAVGAAFADWSPRIVAFEYDPDARATLRALMALNDVPAARVDLRAACTPALLEATLASAVRPAALIDAEGSEALLVDPLRVPSLHRAHLLVEYHDFILPGLSQALVARLQATHHIETIHPAARQPNELLGAGPLLRRLPRLCLALLSEHRPTSAHGWLWFRPKSSVPP